MRTVVVVPTYNERENIADLVNALLDLGIEGLEVLVVDDASPDGTAEAARSVAAARPGVHVLTRGADRGRGAAGREGFLRALSMGADRIVEMDADFSHDPRTVPALLARLEEGAEVAIGSRFVAGGAERDRGLLRRIVTRVSVAYVRILLGTRVRDPNSGFRAFRREALLRVDPASLRAKGPAIVHEVLLRAARAGCRIVECPVLFVDRERGRSKLGIRHLAQGSWFVLGLRAREIFGRKGT